MLEALAFRQAKEAFANLRDTFGKIVRTRPEGWQRNYVVFRRTMHERLAKVGTTGCRLLAARGDLATLRQFEDALARYRHLVTLHQVDWPVVTIDPDDPDYQRSRERVATEYHDFVQLLDEILEQADTRNRIESQRPAAQNGLRVAG